MAAVCLGGVTGGVGKTTLTLALAAALRLQGRSVRSYCIGPGLPAPGSCGSGAAAAAAGGTEQLLEQPVSLDGWLLTEDSARAAFHSLSTGADISIIEGCLGMFDSPTPDSGGEQGSTAQVVGWLRVPLVLVIDAAAFSSPRALVALISGYAGVDGSVPVAGVILNKAPSKALAAELQDALRQAGLGQVAVLGAVPKVEATSSAGDCSGRQQLACPWSPLSPSAASSVCGASCCTSSPQQHQQQPFSLQQLAEMAAQHIDLDRLQALAAGAAVPPPSAPLPPPARTFRVSVGVAHDEAFSGYFTQNLHMLQCSGVQLVRFSPLHDCQLPPGLSAVLLGAGDVPAFAGGLSGNAAMLAALRAFAAAGGLVVGEAAGLMYLSRSLQLAGGQRHPMLGLLPFHTQALSGPAARQPSYVTVEVAQAAHPLLLPGSHMRGLASCCCQVVEERLLGGLSAALAAAAAPADANAASAAADGLAAADLAPAAAAKGAAVSCSYSVMPRGGAAAVAEGYTCGSVLGSCVMVHFGSSPEAVTHLAQRCLRVDVASATAAASAAASQAAAAAAEAAAAADAAAAAEQLGLGQPPLPPGHRALSAPDLQLLMWQYQQYGCADAGPAAAGQQDAWSGVGSPVVGGGVPAAAAFLAGKKSASIPLNMYQMGLTPEQLQQQQQPHALAMRVGSLPGAQQQQQQQGAGPPWNPLPFQVPKRWSLELQRLGSLTSQLLPGGGKGPQQQQQQPQQSSQQSQQPGPGSRAGGQAHHHSQHSHSGSFPGMVHLPEEAPLSDATIQLLDSTMPSLLGRTHHTRLGVAVPLSSGGAAPGAAAGQAAAGGGGAATAGGQLAVAAGGCKPESSAGGGMSKSSSIHEQMSCLAASLAQQDGPAASAAASHCDEWQLRGEQESAHGMPATEPPPQQQQALQHPWPQGSRLSLDQHAAYQPQQAALAAARSRLSLESSAPSGVQQLLGGSEQPGLCAELSFKAMVNAAQHGSNDHLPGAAAAANGMSKSSSAHKLNGWHALPVASSAGSSGAGAGGRIISLSPAATDCLIALGLASRLAGVTDACRPVSQGSVGCSSPLAQLLASIGVDWAADVAQQASGAGAAGQQAAELPVVCRLVEGSDGLPRYKLDEDHIRRVQPSLVVVACDENSDEERHEPHFKQLQAECWPKAGSGAGAAAAAGPGVGGSSGGGSTVAGRAWGLGSACQAAMTSGVAVPGRVRLEVAVVQRVLQRAGVLWPEARAVVLYQRCHSLAEVLEFVLVLAAAAGVPERGVVLVRGLRARLRAAAGRVFVNSGLLTRGLSSDSGCSAFSGSGSSEAALAVAPLHGRRPVVVVLESVVPLRLAGFWVPEMLDLAQAGQAAASPAACEPPRGVPWPELRATAPDVLLLALSGLDAARGALHTAQLACLPGFWSLPAVRAGAVYVCDHTLLLRPGPGLVLGCELLAHLAAPDRQPLPPGLPPGSVFKLSLHSGQRCRPRLVPNYLSRYC